MKCRSEPELIDEENPEWSDEDFRNARPSAEILPKIFGFNAAAEMVKSSGRSAGTVGCGEQSEPHLSKKKR